MGAITAQTITHEIRLRNAAEDRLAALDPDAATDAEVADVIADFFLCQQPPYRLCIVGNPALPIEPVRIDWVNKKRGIAGFETSDRAYAHRWIVDAIGAGLKPMREMSKWNITSPGDIGFFRQCAREFGNRYREAPQMRARYGVPQ